MQKFHDARIDPDSILKSRAPSIYQYTDVIYRPNTGIWGGLYNSAGELLDGVGMYRGPERHLVLPASRITTFPERSKRLSGTYFYVGPFHPHYGHYLLSTLCRFWPLAHERLNGRKILYDSASSAESKFEDSHVSVTMNALGIKPKDLAQISEPVWVDDVIVPEPSFCEQLEVYEQYGFMARTIAARLNTDSVELPKDELVYLSKTKMNSGVWRIINEFEVEDFLKRYGVKIIYPETMNFIDQIAVFNRGNHIISTMGSLIHTSVFSNSGVDMSILCKNDGLISNFLLIDGVRRGKSDYYLPELLVNSTEPGWSASFTLLEPINAARSIYEYAAHSIANR